jgi:lycopene beta-cyclase
MQHDVELLILGGGCAGLSLSMQLAQRGQHAPSALILEQRHCYKNDRTWCFWGDSQTSFAQQTTYQWQQFKVSNAGHEISVDCANTPYHMLAADQFYNVALAALETVPQMQLQMNSNVMAEPQFHNGRWHVETPHGSFSAGRVVDTRPIRFSDNSALMWQSFYGFEIDCVLPVFDPSCVELMDFSIATPDRVAFTYVLPLTARRALVEFTVFAKSPFTADALSRDLQNSIVQRLKGASFTVLRSEQGVLPMGLDVTVTARPVADPSYVHVGLFAGAARPATGYAFQRIQRWAVACGRKLANGGLPIAHPKEPFFQGWMDTLFLNVIRQQPELAPALFMALFSGVASHRVIRFLSERGGFNDFVAMSLALPQKPFLRQLFSLSRWP